MITQQRKYRTWRNLLLIVLMADVILAGLFYTLRFGAGSIDIDTQRQVVAAEGTLATGQLEHHFTYMNGYGVQAQLAWISFLTGLPVKDFIDASAVWVFVVVLAAFLCYREMLGGDAAALVSTLFLIVQPDFLFYVVRGSHEKVTWSLALMLLYLLLRSVRPQRTVRQFILCVSLFYLFFWSMAAQNYFFASTFIFAVALSLVCGWLFHRLLDRGEKASAWKTPFLGRFFLICLAGSIIVFLTVTYLYRTPIDFYYVLGSIWDKASLVLMGAQFVQTPDSYHYVQKAWISQGAYLGLTGLQWLISALSVLAWALAFKKLRSLERGRWVLWLMYSAFGVLLVLGVLIDFTGALSSNMQLRMFTPFTIFSSAMAGELVLRAFRRWKLYTRRAVVLAGIALGAFALLTSSVKISNDPLLGNQWMFYTPAEAQAGTWMEKHLSNATIWLEMNDRLSTMINFQKGYPNWKENEYVFGIRRSEPPKKLFEPYPYILITQTTLLRANRSGIPLPSTAGYARIYDSGTVWLYKLPPQTPYQH